ncbi:MAG: Ig-like domain-containing protein [Gammaproteobacteria bacterium]
MGLSASTKSLLLVWFSFIILILVSASTAMAQIPDDELPSEFIEIPDPPFVLNERCTVSVLNRTTRVDASGDWFLPNIPANLGRVRARATCVDDGVTRSGQTDFFTVPVDSTVHIHLGVAAIGIDFDEVAAVPESVAISSPMAILTVPGVTSQLSVTATFPDGSTSDVTAAGTGTNYTISNPAVATVGPDGLVTAVSSGTVLVSARNEGALGLIRLQVVLSGDSDGDGIPDDVELTNGLDPNNPVDALEDVDQDGLTNKQELVDLGTNFQVADSDGDGIGDGEEVAAGEDGFITNPLLVDSDGDGIRDGLELATGSDPTNPSSFNLAQALSAIEVTPPALVLTVNTLIGEAFRQLTVTGQLIDGTTIDLTATSRGTNYSTSDPIVCSFGAPDGRVFAGSDGTCTVTATNNGFSDDLRVFVETFAPTALSFVAIPGFANNVDVSGGFAYVAAGTEGLQVVDVSSRSAPSIVAARSTPGNANDVKIMGHTAYVADGAAGLQVLDITDPLAPEIIGSVDTPGDARDVVIKGTLALVADGSEGLQLINIADPTAPNPIGSVDTPGVAKGVDADPDTPVAVVADGSSGVQVVDITDPANPAISGTVPIGGDARDVALKGDFAFIADFASSFTVVNVSDPGAPVVETSTPNTSGGLLRDVAFTDGFAFGADVFFLNGVPIFDVSVPARPVPRAILDFSTFRDDNGTGIAVDGNFVYLTASLGNAGTENGTVGDTRLYIGQYLALEDTQGVPPSVSITSPSPDDVVVEGASLPLIVEASDDIAVVAVDFIVDNAVVFTDDTAPYQFNFTVPVGTSLLSIGARAIDPGGNVGFAGIIDINVISDPGTTVVGAVTTDAGNPLEGATVACQAVSGITEPDGAFEIADVPTSRGDIRCTATTIAADGKALIGTSAAVSPVVAGITDVGQIVAAEAGPTIVEPGWALTRVVNFSDGQAAHYNPIDGLLYAGRRLSPSGGGGLYRIEEDGSSTLLAASDRPSAIVVDRDSGDIFVAEDFGGRIFRTAFGETGRAIWVSGFHSGDDDPVGMAIAPKAYTGSVIVPGEGLVVDRGFEGLDEVWRFSSDIPEGEIPIHTDNGTLVDAVDITIGLTDVYLVDTAENNPGRIYRLNAGGSLTLIPTSEPILAPVGISTDPLSGDLFVLDSSDDRLVRVNPGSGAVSNLFTGLTIPVDGWAGVDVRPDGTQLFITDDGADVIFTFSR